MTRHRASERSKSDDARRVDRELDKALEDTFPASDPVAITAPGGPVSPGEDPKKKQSGQRPRK